MIFQCVHRIFNNKYTYFSLFAWEIHTKSIMDLLLPVFPVICLFNVNGNTSGRVPQVKPRQRELTHVKAHLATVTSPPNPTTGCSRLIFPVPFSYLIFIFPGAPYRIFFLFLPWLPCNFYLVITITLNICQQWIFFKFKIKCTIVMTICTLIIS